MRKQKKEAVKIRLNKMIMIVIFTIGCLGLVYFINNNKIDDASEEVDHKKKYGLKYTYTKEIGDNIILSMPYPDDLKINEFQTFALNIENSEGYYDLIINLCEAKYNFENYSIDEYIEKIKENLDETEEKNVHNKKYELHYIESKREYQDEVGSYYFDSYYIIKYGKMIFSFNVYYQNQELYEKYYEMVTYMISNMEIINNNDISEYIDILNENTNVYLLYNELLESEKEKYDEIYTKLFKEKEKIVLNTFEKDYHTALGALVKDAIYLDIENYDIYMRAIENDNIYRDIGIDWEINDVLETLKYNKDTIKYIEIGAEYLTNGIILFYNRSNYTQARNIELNDKEMKTFYGNVDNIINNMPENLTTYGKYKYLAECVSELAEYDFEEENSNSLVSVFLNKRSMCNGYSEAYYYLCSKVGLLCGIIAVNEEDAPGHAFNYIKLGNEYYFVDTTWQDSEGEKGNFAFPYDENIENGHNIYIKHFLEDEIYYEYSKELINNLGTTDWYNLQNFLE